jgi:hypothetical protein
MWWVPKIVLIGVWGYSLLTRATSFGERSILLNGVPDAKTNDDSRVSIVETPRYCQRWNEIIDWIRLLQLRLGPLFEM